MNYLAHLFLSGENSGFIAGNFLADFIGNKDLAALPGDIRDGVHLHRSIDTFTDNHPAVRAANKVLHPYYRKYAPVVIDMYGDYFLAKNWALFSSEQQPDFYSRIYNALLLRRAEMPLSIHKRLEHMVDGNWLASYTHFEGLAYAFLRMSERVRFNMDFSNAVEVLQRHEADLEGHFLAFFPDLVSYVGEYGVGEV